MGSDQSKQEPPPPLKIVTASASNNLVLVGSTKTVSEGIVEVPPPKVILKPDYVPEPVQYAAALRGDLITTKIASVIPGFT